SDEIPGLYSHSGYPRGLEGPVSVSKKHRDVVAEEARIAIGGGQVHSAIVVDVEGDEAKGLSARTKGCRGLEGPVPVPEKYKGGEVGEDHCEVHSTVAVQVHCNERRHQTKR